MSTEKKAFALRLDPALHAAIERIAAQDFRSVNAELEVLLREALDRRVKRGIEAEGEGLLLGWHDRSTKR